MLLPEGLISLKKGCRSAVFRMEPLQIITTAITSASGQNLRDSFPDSMRWLLVACVLGVFLTDVLKIISVSMLPLALC